MLIEPMSIVRRLHNGTIAQEVMSENKSNEKNIESARWLEGWRQQELMRLKVQRVRVANHIE